MILFLCFSMLLIFCCKSWKKALIFADAFINSVQRNDKKNPESFQLQTNIDRRTSYCKYVRIPWKDAAFCYLSRIKQRGQIWNVCALSLRQVRKFQTLTLRCVYLSSLHCITPVPENIESYSIVDYYSTQLLRLYLAMTTIAYWIHAWQLNLLYIPGDACQMPNKIIFSFNTDWD